MHGHLPSPLDLTTRSIHGKVTSPMFTTLPTLIDADPRLPHAGRVRSRFA